MFTRTESNGDIAIYSDGFRHVAKSRLNGRGFFEFTFESEFVGSPLRIPMSLRQATCCATCTHLQRSANNVTTCGLHSIIVQLQNICDDHAPEPKEAKRPARRALGPAGVTVYDYFEGEVDE